MAKRDKTYISMTDRETGWGWLYFLLELFIIPILLQAGNGLLPRKLDAASLNFVYYVLNFAFLTVIFRKFLRKNLICAGKRFWDFLQAVILGFVAYYVSSTLLSWLLPLIYPGFANVNDQNIAAQAGSRFALMALGTVLLVPAAEELCFRGLIFHGLRGRSRVWAYALSTLAFCLVHISGYMGSYSPVLLILCALQYVPAGLFLAWAYEKCGSIFAPILIHTAVNAIGIYAMR